MVKSGELIGVRKSRKYDIAIENKKTIIKYI